MGLGCWDSCNKLRWLKVLLLTSLFLVGLQYVLNLVIYRYTSQHLGYDLFRRLAHSDRVVLSPAHRLADLLGLNADLTDNHTATVTGTNITLASSGSSNFSAVVPSNASQENSSLPLCPLIPPNLVGPLATYRDALSWEELAEHFPDIGPGGHYEPQTCRARHHVAIVIPYRDRDLHLRILLHNLHAMLPRQQLHYRILVVEMAQPTKFNRALLMNVGFLEGLKLEDFQCFIFHDVDLLPENDRNLYTCPESPRHMSVAIDKFKYRLPYTGIFGGVSAMTTEQFRSVNGFSNVYFGWGGEDDDMFKRIQSKKLKVIRYPLEIARYKMIVHQREGSNPANPHRFKLLNTALSRMEKDGLSSVKYEVETVKEFPLYTWVKVKVDEEANLQS